jgi:hypothetical protein
MHPFFKDIDWQKVYQRQMEPSIALRMEETGQEDEEEKYLAMGGVAKDNYQDKVFLFMDKDYTTENQTVNRVK